MLLASALLLELLVRLGLNHTIRTLGMFPEPLLQDDVQVGSLNRPGDYVLRQSEYETAFRINAHGYRAEDDFAASDRPIVAFLGDSITEGLQVPEAATFVERVEAAVQADCRNYGVLGHGTANSLAIYRRDVRPTRPTAVVLTVFANDPRNCSPTLETGLSSWRPAYRLDDDGQPAALLDFVLPKRRRDSRLRQTLRRANSRCETIKELQRALLRRQGGPDATWQVYSDPWPPAMVEAVGLLDWCLQALATEVAADGARLIVGYVPAVQEVRPEAWDSIVGTDASAADSRRLERHVERVAAAAGVPYVDCREAFVAADQAGEVLHYPKDHHLTAAGHTVVAAELIPAVNQALETR